jgi:phage repressor protein C with HTH and peptisase S24 domain
MTVNLHSKEISRRILGLRKRAGLSQYAWARLLGMTIPQVSNYEKGRVPDPPFLVKIAQSSGVSVDWILTGQEAIPAGIRGLASQTLIFSRSLQKAPETVDLAQHLAVPVLIQKAATGPPRPVTTKDIKCWAWIQRSQFGRREGHRLVAVEMVGDSMQPIIRSGSTLVIDLDDKKLAKRGVYAITTLHGQWTIKHVKKTGHKLILLPANSDTDDTYPPSIDTAEVSDPIVGRVVWAGQNLA